MERFFNIFGKTMLIVLVLGGLTYAGYYFGKQTNETQKPENIIIETEDIPHLTPTPKEQATITPSALVTIVAGLSKSAGLSFDQYSIMTPNDWTSTKESQTEMDEKLILTKDGYSISIFQAATGGALCLYPGDADFEGPSSKFEIFVPLTTQDNRTLRRSGDKNGKSFTICQKSPDGSYQQPTNYGHVSIKLPSAWDQEGLDEVDQIINSLKKI